MTDNTQPEALRLSERISDVMCAAEKDARAIARAADELVRQHTRIAELEAEIVAIGAGGVSAPLVGRAAPPTAQAGGWRPIETAPKDCQAILVTEGRFCHCVEWNEEFGWWAVDDNKLGPFRLRGSSPTHWMPLPPTPTSAEGVEHG